MERKVTAIMAEEVAVRTAKSIGAALEIVSKIYDIPLDRLLKDTADIECKFCIGVNKGPKRCLRDPEPNGYCKVHRNQVPMVAPKSIVRVKAPWE